MFTVCLQYVYIMQLTQKLLQEWENNLEKIHTGTGKLNQTLDMCQGLQTCDSKETLTVSSVKEQRLLHATASPQAL